MPALPLLAALRAADAGSRREDLIAGLITAILLVPQAMAYAQLAGLPPHAGLIASIVPPVIYALFGSSRTLAVGPVAVAALMVAHALQDYAGDDLSQWSAGAMILAAESGLTSASALISPTSHSTPSYLTASSPELAMWARRSMQSTWLMQRAISAQSSSSSTPTFLPQAMASA